MGKLITFIVLLFLGLMLAWSSFFTVEPWELVMVKYLWSIQPVTYTEWFYWKNPFLWTVITMNLRSNKVEDNAIASTKDLQSVSTSVSITYQITKDGAMEVYRRFWDDTAIATNVVIPNIKEAIRSIVANYKADELITKRAEVSSAIHEKLQLKLNEFGMKVSDINVQEIKFSEQFNNSIEAKVKAEQDALTKKNQLEQTKYEAEQQIVKAKAEAETIRIQAEAVKSQWGAEYVQLKLIEKRNGVMPQYQMWGNSSTLLQLPTQQ